METEQPKEKVEELKESAQDLTEHLGQMADTFYKLAVLNLTQKATNAAAAGISVIVLCTFGVFFLIFGGIALGWWLGDLIDNRAGGFAIIAGFFLLLTICIIALRKKIVFPYFRNRIIRKVYD
jgi:predicted lipid-binding transport protein (Tim44 family)